MSANQSYLTEQKYNYDMVLGTTQASINATMKNFLYKYDGQEFVKCYVGQFNPKTKKNEIVETDYEQLKTDVGFDPFAIPDATASDDPRLKSLYDKKFAFGFKSTMGLPTNFPLSDIPDVITLDKGNSLVTYALTCKNFEIINMSDQWGTLTWANIKQSEQKAPWTFKFNVSLDLFSNDSAFSHLPADVQNQVKNLCPSSMFSVQQLYLDLNTAGLESAPTVANLPPTSTAYVFLTRVFLNAYFLNLQNKGVSPSNPKGNYLLGYAIKPSKAGNISSIVPTDLNFMVSPYLDDKGIATKNYDLYTLNWLVMTKSHTMPAPVPFEWNWVDKANESSFSGAMSIKKTIFAQFINQLFSPTLSQISLIPTVDIDVNLIKISVTCSCAQNPNPGTYTLVNDTTSRVATFSYSKSAHDSDTFVPNWGNVTLRPSVQSDIYFEGSVIRCVTTAGAWMHLNVEGGVSEGDLVKYKCETKYQLAVDADGKLNVTMLPAVFTDLSHFDTNAWSQFITLGSIDGMISSIKGYWEVMKSYLAGESQTILAMLNGSSTWVFPGGETLVFKDVAFSSHQDFVSHVTYAEPTAKRLMAARVSFDAEKGIVKGKTI